MSEPRSWIVADDEAGDRLDVAVSRKLGEPRARTQQRVAAGEVEVEGETAAKSQRLVAGQRVTVREPAPVAVAVPPDPVPIRYADDHLAVVAKPAGLVVHAGAGVRSQTLVDALREMGVPLAAAGGDERPGIVHRLDRGTSGLLVVAKTDEAYHGLVGALSRREIERRYWALTDGVPDPPRATIDAPIARDPQRRTRFRADPEGKPSVTHYDVEEALAGAARLSVRLGTGRTHQVRVHLSAVGHPVAGDRLYGAQAARARDLCLERPALHAERLAFDHPVTGESVDVTEPLPGDLERALARLRET